MAFSSRRKWILLFITAAFLLLCAVWEALPLLRQFSFVDKSSAHAYWNRLTAALLTAVLAVLLITRRRLAAALVIGGIAFTRTAAGIPVIIGIFEEFSSENYSYLLAVLGLSAAWIVLFACALRGIRKAIGAFFFLPAFLYGFLLLYSAIRLGIGATFTDAGTVLSQLRMIAALLLLGIWTGFGNDRPSPEKTERSVTNE